MRNLLHRVEKPSTVSSTGLLALLVIGGLGLACSGSPPPEPAPIAVPPTTAPPPPPPRSPLPPVVVEITPGDEGESKPSLVEAAKAERERRRKSGKPVAVVKNKNLQDYAKDGELTFVEDTGPEADSPEVGEGTEGEDKSAEERFWRGRFLELRLEWQRTAEDLKEYERQAAELRRRFYAEDDPFVRDGQIKPEWDLVLERQAKAREDLRRFPRELQRLHQDAQRAGADPEWTREGIEIQPAVAEEDRPDGTAEDGQLPTHQIEEPTVVDEEQEP